MAYQVMIYDYSLGLCVYCKRRIDIRVSGAIVSACRVYGEDSWWCSVKCFINDPKSLASDECQANGCKPTYISECRHGHLLHKIEHHGHIEMTEWLDQCPTSS